MFGAAEQGVRPMKKEESLELVIAAFGELSDDDWEAVVEAGESDLRRRISEFVGEKPSNIEVKSADIGRGADWTVLAIYFVAATIAIPEAHKRIRENLEEWQRIYRELNAFFTWVIKGRAALYPDEYLFLKSIEALSVEGLSENIEYKGVLRIPEDDPTMQGREALAFSFSDGKALVQIAVSRKGKVLWLNRIEL